MHMRSSGGFQKEDLSNKAESIGHRDSGSERQENKQNVLDTNLKHATCMTHHHRECSGESSCSSRAVY